MTPSDRDRLLKFCRLLASDQDGERSIAASMANKLAEKLGGWDRVISGSGQSYKTQTINEWADQQWRRQQAKQEPDPVKPMKATEQAAYDEGLNIWTK